ncbi:uncharacterized protein OCT59_003005 [Rhizophagus irregularis]|uniref:Uncharacterized protein n=1 Tax=Rhizophagus irregularis (strain DAOM 181602 / DAOM 197198 / MUCL 43194) TaxID=747089 RepID=A0A2P4QEG5_RHIID|nr:hypothetical protein GLOIN_2v1769436 [Rhizophagus irregularis DAOM 181602=DAOM 197198]POG76010.1 hypothetical protein GLOIN_2v1769436 [Rhizophagus irregularis DAOM 181602=DAOM 197198]UZO11436.1 hypothetical protein OCT59_003005 [Rhizophagus irregularis]GET63589.1 hypothetical protein GLOIN_2v1769436 [Rhizophagus irregularis DAOM 181602=DAOM 197198]CAG8682014.1 9920_t:CDS:2 [Rhizophagus irregularis]|eukprot:XP_025182876.1 hypothetical protein GLOIN_2v1769436 [Rhizophagus irregularis DAOM 181602=DAOM 197198]
MKLDFVHYHENAVIPQNILVSLPLKLEDDDLLLTSNTAAAWKNASKEVREECQKLALIAKMKHEEVYGSPPRQTRRRLKTSAHNTNLNALFYFDDLMQNIPYYMTFPPSESELGEPQI